MLYGFWEYFGREILGSMELQRSFAENTEIWRESLFWNKPNNSWFLYCSFSQVGAGAGCALSAGGNTNFTL